jgi:hypothetical protein
VDGGVDVDGFGELCVEKEERDQIVLDWTSQNDRGGSKGLEGIWDYNKL